MVDFKANLDELWGKLTGDGKLDEADMQKLEEAGMVRSKAIKKARDEELTLKISGGKALEEGNVDKISFTTQVGNKEMTVEVPLNTNIELVPKTPEAQKALEEAGYVKMRTENNLLLGVRADGSTENKEDVAIQNEVLKLKEELARLKEEQATRDAYEKAAKTGLEICLGSIAAIGGGLLISEAPLAVGAVSRFLEGAPRAIEMVLGRIGVVGRQAEQAIAIAMKGAPQLVTSGMTSKAIITALTGVALESCSVDIDDFTKQSVGMTIINDYSDLVAAIRKGDKDAQDLIREFMNRSDTNIQAVIDAINQNTTATKDTNKLISDLISFLDNKAQILELNLAGIQTLLSDGNTISKDNADKLYKAIQALKDSVDTNGTKIDTTNEILGEIRDLIAVLPENIKDKFAGDIADIISAIKANGDKLDSIKCILRWINANVIRNNQLTADNGKKLGEILKGLKDFKNMTKDQLNTIISLIKQNNCLTAQGNAKLDAIYKKMTKGFGDLAVLLCRLDENQQARNDKVINAINNAANRISASVYDTGNGIISAMCDGFNRLYELDAAGFNALIDQGNLTNSYLASLDGKVGRIADITLAIYNKPTVDIAPIVRELQNQGVTLNAIYSGMSVINDNIVQSDANQTAIGKKVIELLYRIEGEMPADYTNILCAILNKIPDGFPSNQGNVDLGGVEQRLDAILCAIKNHEVEVKVDVNGKCHCCDNDTPEKPDTPCNSPSDPAVHEGVKTDLDWLLG